MTGESEDWMRRFHLGTETVTGTGELSVRRGTSRLAGALCALLRLPRTGEPVPARVVVHRRPARVVVHRRPAGTGPRPLTERWVRHIGPYRLTTTQVRTGPHGRERHGLLVLHTRTTAGPGEVTVTQTRTVLGAGPLRVRLPARVAPQVSARARVEPGDLHAPAPRFHIEVRVTLPVVGLLLSYTGHLCEERGDRLPPPASG
ncbi:DUF4166 domain-containing protein [Sphaerisporangium sp. B11E5]|uniref:DUF4166 domain-containing protein n=1 Tax=Sphaerisporangium sp. B11E5 TaxID=3153563 RepID=UPI00325E99FD